MFDYLKEELTSLKNRSPEKFFCLISLVILIIIMWSYIIFFVELNDNQKTVAKNQIKDKSSFASEQRSDKIISRENKTTESKDKKYYIRETPFQKTTANQPTNKDDETIFSYQTDNLENNQQEENKPEFTLEEEVIEKVSFSIQPLGILSGYDDKLLVVKRADGSLHYRIGDKIEDYLIVDIKRELIVLENNGERLSLKLEIN